EMMIYPRPHGALPMPAQSGHMSGARPRGGSDADEWLGLRPFRDGDSPRQVDWKAYAREAPLLVKEYRPAGAELHLFDFAQLTDPDTEARLSQLARWVMEAEAHGERYGVALPGVLLPPDRGPEHRHRCLAALAVFGTDDGARHGGGAGASRKRRGAAAARVGVRGVRGRGAVELRSRASLDGSRSAAADRV